MKEDVYMPDVLDFAYQVIDLHKKNMSLERELEHYKAMDKIHTDSLAATDKHHKEFLGIMVNAVLDPESSINKGQAALIEKEISKEVMI